MAVAHPPPPPAQSDPQAEGIFCIQQVDFFVSDLQCTDYLHLYKYLSLTEFKVRTVSYEPSFFPLIMAQVRSVLAINQREKNENLLLTPIMNIVYRN